MVYVEMVNFHFFPPSLLLLISIVFFSSSTSSSSFSSFLLFSLLFHLGQSDFKWPEVSSLKSLNEFRFQNGKTRFVKNGGLRVMPKYIFPKGFVHSRTRVESSGKLCSLFWQRTPLIPFKTNT